jgi:hypothetical protein
VRQRNDFPGAYYGLSQALRSSKLFCAATYRSALLSTVKENGARKADDSPMLLTITTTHNPATDLGYLLHKNPARAQSFDLSFGKAHVFYPEAKVIQLDDVESVADASTGGRS